MSYKMIQEHLGITGPRLKHLQHRVFGKSGANNHFQGFGLGGCHTGKQRR
jgi:hypothetical protein